MNMAKLLPVRTESRKPFKYWISARPNMTRLVLECSSYDIIARIEEMLRESGRTAPRTVKSSQEETSSGVSQDPRSARNLAELN
jgi:hypothetical protein